MRIKDLLEAIEKPSTDGTNLATIQSNVFGTESGYGKADTSKPNYAGATGPMQIMPGTFDWMKSKGMIPKDYDISNPQQNREAGNALLAHYYEKYGGDDAKVYAAYYGGPGAVNKDGTINAHWKDLKNPKAPTIGQYIELARAKSGKGGDGYASANPSLADKVGSAISSLGSTFKSSIDSLTSTNPENDEVVVLINGKKKKFKSRKEAEQAIAMAQQQGADVQTA